ncbi:hypothetical protein [Prauserella muralis]|uniref:Uncharacterized protein n=1 Tax=Prauserella muralis TaxID=588067 RepID=A0A2V4B4Q2_9PSEU|nr:hypothetical protein [Prauserella muralis]PXY28065.1 hypothetical protein BAY60_17145 [Prauserella muralis]TWE22136.1 hypothetical protein FHX69_3370 [Prauserella muralis]
MSRSATTTRRLAIAGVCALSLAICCGLAWWQWERYSSAGGTFQNLGYVLQWPLFGLFPAFMVWRIRRLKAQAEAGRSTGQGEPQGDRAAWGRRPADVPAPRPAVPRTRQTAGAGDAEDPEDAELAAYNRYLAELNARDHEVK